MQKYLKTVVLFFLASYYSVQVSAQNFENGQFGIELSDAGEIEVFAPDLNAENIQIDRFSILAAVMEDTAQVFDYAKDADSIMAAFNLEDPLYGDYQLFTLFDNSYSNAPPNLRVKINVFGWNEKSYALAKYTVINDTNLTLNMRIGYEALPQVDGQYGFEVVKYEPDEDLVSIFVDSSGSTTGIKLLSENINSLKVIDWYSGYNDFDSHLHEQLYSDEIDQLYESGTDGTVITIGGNDFTLESGDSAVVWVGLAYGNNKAEMEVSMTELQEVYTSIVTGVEEDITAKPLDFLLSQNYPNPFNPSTKIKFSIPENGNVNLSLYDILGEKVDELINSDMNAGSYIYDFSAPDYLSSGVYLYVLRTGGVYSTKKMILIK